MRFSTQHHRKVPVGCLEVLPPRIFFTILETAMPATLGSP
jgi:hypothetical protein